jgi:acrylyl-CoA reductase (NADPH)
VGTIAIALLTAAGFKVAAATGKSSEEQFLQQLGAVTVLDRAEFSEAGKPLQKERWAGVVDTVGSNTLVNACAQTRYGGAVAACGLAQGMDFPATVAPFILRGVSLLGIDSVMAPKQRRMTAWERLAHDLNAGALDSIAQEVALGEAIASAGELMDGKVRGRVVVDVNR